MKMQALRAVDSVECADAQNDRGLAGFESVDALPGPSRQNPDRDDEQNRVEKHASHASFGFFVVVVVPRQLGISVLDLS